MALSLSGRKLAIEVGGCVVAVVIGTVAVNYFRHDVATYSARYTPAAAQPDAAARSTSPASSGRRAVELVAQRNGHFFADAEINGRTVNVMVDTGASMVALTYEDARTAGISLRDSDFTRSANTANGVARFAPVIIDRLAIGSVEVRDVEAGVMEQGKLGNTLLGMSFISKLGRFDMKSGRLVLEE